MKNKLFYSLYNKNGAKEITDIFLDNKIDIRFVGGCIRDYFLGINKHDIDFAVKCEPEETMNLLKKNNIKFNDYGQKYGSIIAFINKDKFEITSLRKDLNQTGRDTEIIFTKNWRQDALRRDFTINAFYLSCSGKFYDYFDGYTDLINKKIKFIGDIETRIKEDYLRIFRFYRFLGCFEKINISENYKKILKKYTPKVREHISNERMMIELIKMLKNKYKKNSFVSFNNSFVVNDLIINVNKWWSQDSYEIGFKKCLNQINNLVNK